MQSAESDMLPKLQNFDKNVKIDPYEKPPKKKKEGDEEDELDEDG